MSRPNNGAPRGDNGNHDWGPTTFMGRLPAAERQNLLALNAPTLHPAGGHLLVEGDRGRFVLLLHGGPVKVVVHDSSGREHLLALRRRGDILGELSYLDNQPRSASAITTCQTYVTRICAEWFSRFLDENPRAGIELARCVSARLRDADRSRMEVSTDSVALRVARFLAQEAGPGRGHASIPFTQGHVAQLVHAAEVTVNRILREFKQRDLIRTAYGSIEVPCLGCLDLLLVELSTEQREGGKDIRGCGGRDPHGSR